MTRRLGALAPAISLALTGLAPASEAFAEIAFKPQVRLQMDYTRAEADRADYAVDPGYLRRLRVGVTARTQHISAIADINIDRSGDVTFNDVYADISPDPDGPWTLRVGQFKPPTLLDFDNSMLHRSPIEIAAHNSAFGIDRRLGLAAYYSRPRHGFAIGAFASNVNDEAFGEGYALHANGYVRLADIGEDGSWYLTTALRYREQGSGEPDFTYRARSFATVAERMVATPRLTDSDWMIGADTVLTHGGGWLAAEFARLEAGPAAFSGGYAEGGWIWGGRRPVREGRFARPQVDRPVSQGGPGAFSLFLRLDQLDLDDSGIAGGRQTTLIGGADWYPARNSRISLNVWRADADLGTRAGIGAPFRTVLDAGFNRDDVTGLTLRLQADY